MIERAETAGERIGWLVAERAGDAESEVFRRLRHDRYEAERVVQRHLQAVAQRGVSRAAIDVIDSDHVREEHAIEEAALEQPGELDPMLRLGIAVRLVARVTP
jgi:hypothetical protein